MRISKGTTHIRVSRKAKKYLEEHGKENGLESLRKAVDDVLFKKKKQRRKWDFKL